MTFKPLHFKTGRRAVLKGLGAAGAGLVIGVHLPHLARAQENPAKSRPAHPNAFVHVAPDDTVTVLVKHLDKGQGVYTGLPTLVAEELDADWAQMRAEFAPANAELYKNFAFGMQGTGGSSSIANSYVQMRKAGAAARDMLVAAAARQWGVDVGEITVNKGQISHKRSGKSGGFGEFADAAADMPFPKEPKLKDPKDFVLIGTDRPKLDTEAKTRGEANYTMDHHLDDMVVVMVAHPPKFGATVKSFDADKTKAVPGVIDVKQIPEGVAVYADKTWTARKARALLDVTWDFANAETRSSADLIAQYRDMAQKPGMEAKARGDAAGTISAASKTLDAVYEFPYLAHAPMEPMDYIVRTGDGKAQCWAGSQIQTLDQRFVAQALGLDKPGDVAIDTVFAGGSFGRRAQPDSGIAVEAAHAAKAYGKHVPVKMVWDREDDMRGGRYRPLNVHRLQGAIDADGNVTAWNQTIVGQSIFAGGPMAAQITDGIDPSSVEGADDLPYAIPNFKVTLHTTQVGVPVLWWRSVGHTHTGYSTETFLDELLALGGKDPVEARLAMLGDHPRHAGVLKAVAEAADWGAKPAEGRARGVAVHKSFNTYVAQIAEVSEGKDGLPKVHKVWCAVDCGVAVNPNIIHAQMESGIGYGLGAILYDAITLDEGRVVQGNFDTYRAIRIHEMPEVATTVVKSAEAPTGVGEPGVPPIGPAVANAWARLTGKRVRKLPFLNISTS